jgi:predicted component of type VI protein secretion system
MRSWNRLKAAVVLATMLVLVSACGSTAAKSTSPTTTL